MKNLRIISDNAIDRATLTASTTAGTLGVANLQNSRKSSPWRAVGTTARLSASWATPERIGGVFLPFCNLSPTATMRVRVSNESAVENQLTFSDHFTRPGWQIAGAFIVPDTAVTPEGSTGAAKFVEEAINTSLHELYRSFTAVAARRTTVSICVKAAGRSKVRLAQVTSGYAIGAAAIFDLAVGTVSAVSYFGGVTGALASLVPLGNGWYRCAIDLTPPTSGTWYLALDLITGTNTTAYLGDGVSGVYVTHAQIEAGSLSSYYPATVNFTGRASTGTFVGSNGLLQTAAANVARMQYNPLNLAALPFLLLENAATNLALQSGDISHVMWGARWGGAASVVADPAVLAPDGTPAYKVTSTTGGSGIGQGVALTAGVTYTFSMWVAAGTSPRSLGVWAFSGGGATLAATTIPANLPMARYSVTYTAAATGTYYFGLQSLLLGNTLWCSLGQVQVGAYPDSYIPTTTVAVTRAADVATSTLATRPAGYIDAWQSYDYDSGAVLACPAPSVALRGFTPAQASSAYAYGGGAYARHWLLTQTPARGLAVDIADSGSLQGYIEAAGLVAGAYWSPLKNADYGASLQPTDTGENYRSGGDLRSDAGTRSRKLSLQLSSMSAADRSSFLDIVRGCGTSWPMLVSLLPEAEDLSLERDHTVYGKLSSISAMTMSYFANYAAPLEIEEV